MRKQVARSFSHFIELSMARYAYHKDLLTLTLETARDLKIFCNDAKL